MKKIFMVCYGGGHVKIIAPLYKKLISEFNIELLALTSARNYLEKLDIPHKSFKDFRHLMDERAINLGLEQCKVINPKAEDEEETIAYMGLNLRELEKTHGLKKAQIKFKENGRGSFMPLELLSYIIDEVAPDLIITTNAPRAELASLKISREKNIPSICILDNLWITNEAVEIANNGYANYICVLSKTNKKKLANTTNFNENNIIVTGTPVFDKLKKLKRNKINKSLTTILLADCDLPGAHPRYPGIKGDPTLGYEVRRELNKIALSEGYEVIFRPHPSQAYDYSEYKNIRISHKEEDLHQLLKRVDIVVTAISTVGFEGLFIGAKLISIEGSVFSQVASFEELGLSFGIKSALELENAIFKLNKKDLELNKNFLLYNGNSVKNIVTLCKNIL